jgi:hypothetical protein
MNFYIRKIDEKYVINWLVFQIFQDIFKNFDRLWLNNEKLKSYPYTLGLH